jgi:thiol-disulfide isomerase/thioredoxin
MQAQVSLPANLSGSAAEAYQQGVKAEQQSQLDVALDRYEAALKQSPGSQLCMESILRVQLGMTNEKAALGTAAKMISSATDGRARAHAEMLEAEIYYRQWSGYSVGGGAYEKDPKRATESLRKSEAVLQKATLDDPGNEPLRMLHAHVLAGLHRDEDASREFVACTTIAGTSDIECKRALHFSKDADLARQEPAPEFKATTLEGQPISLDALAGKIVLIDFWGSWCRYCVRDADYVQSMLSSFNAKSFVLLEVNVGDSSSTWANYVKQNHMQGVQMHDEQDQMQSLFHVNAFPTYILLDGDGVIRKRWEGDKGDLRGEIRNLLEKQQGTPAAAGSASNEDESSVIRR